MSVFQGSTLSSTDQGTLPGPAPRSAQKAGPVQSLRAFKLRCERFLPTESTVDPFAIYNLRHYAKIHAATEELVGLSISVSGLLFAIMIIAIMIVFPIIHAFMIGMAIIDLAVAAAITICLMFASFCIGFAAPTSTLRALERRLRVRSSTHARLGFAIAASSLWVFFLAWSTHDLDPRASNLNFVLVSTFLGTAGMTAILWILGIVMALWLAVMRWRQRRLYPDAYLVIDLLKLLEAIQRCKWIDLFFRRRAINELEMLAKLIEHHLPQRIGGADPSTESWLQERGAHIAAAMRQKKRIACMPTCKTRQVLCTFLVDLLTNVIRGDWDKLPNSKPPRVLVRHRLGWVIQISRTLMIAALPFLLIRAYELVPGLAQPDESSRVWLELGALLWAALTLLFKLDPDLQMKTSLLKDLAALRPGSKDK